MVAHCFNGDIRPGFPSVMVAVVLSSVRSTIVYVEGFPSCRNDEVCKGCPGVYWCCSVQVPSRASCRIFDGSRGPFI
jgi:hypothetical protein